MVAVDLDCGDALAPLGSFGATASSVGTSDRAPDSFTRFTHCTLILLRTSGELLTSLVRFLTGASPTSSVATMPNAHMSQVVVLTPSTHCSVFTSGICQEEAESGCSCRKNLPPFTCIM